MKWQERRDAGMVKQEASERPHKNTNHSGSTKTVLRTWCKDCDTYISVVSRDAVKAEASDKRVMNEDDEAPI